MIKTLLEILGKAEHGKHGGRRAEGSWRGWRRQRLSAGPWLTGAGFEPASSALSLQAREQSAVRPKMREEAGFRRIRVF